MDAPVVPAQDTAFVTNDKEGKGEKDAKKYLHRAQMLKPKNSPRLTKRVVWRNGTKMTGPLQVPSW